MKIDYDLALSELGAVLGRIDQPAIEQACDMIVSARHIVLYGCGREGLQMRGFAMRLYHLGCHAVMVADMNTPPLGDGDLFIVSAGPGELSTVTALMGVARKAGAKIVFLTATPDAPVADLADHVLLIPAQTMASDQSGTTRSVLPMGSLYEGALFMLFEMIVLMLRDKMNIDPGEMRGRHTNME